MPDLVLRVGDCVLADELQFNQLQQLIGVGDALEDGAQVLQRLVVADCQQGGERVPLTRSITFRLEESLKELWGVWHQHLVVLED